MISLKTVSITLGILAGSAGLTNSGYNLYNNFIVEPNLNVEYNRSLIAQEPLVVEMVEIHPDPKIAMTVEVTIKIFSSGDILVESGSKREIIPFRLYNRVAMLDRLMPVAWAGEKTTIDGVEYEVETLRFIESITSEGSDRQKRVRKFSDGTVETSIIDIRSNTVLETGTEKVTFSDSEIQAIGKSPYKKKIFRHK